MGLLEGRTVLITGALGTIGCAMVARYGAEGARVIALDRPGVEDADARLAALGTGIRYVGWDLNDLHGTERAAMDTGAPKPEAADRARRCCKPCCFLSSAQADLITGQDIHCDGGW